MEKFYYRLDENGKIKDSADFKYADDCIETDKKIVAGFDGILRFEEETKEAEYLQKKAQLEAEVERGLAIDTKKVRLEELRKDIVQDVAGLIIPNIEEKKAEYRTILNEVRVLQGKQPRDIVSRETI